MKIKSERNSVDLQFESPDKLWAYLRSNTAAKELIQRYAVEAVRDELATIDSTLSQQISDMTELITNAKQRIKQYALEALKDELAELQRSVDSLVNDLADVTLEGLQEIRDDLSKQFAVNSEAIKAEAKALREKELDFHSVLEIRAIIDNNIDKIQSYFKDRPIHLGVLIDHLQIYTQLRPGDTFMSNGKVARWDKQVCNAITKGGWPTNPFVKTSRGVYRIEYWKKAS